MKRVLPEDRPLPPNTETRLPSPILPQPVDTWFARAVWAVARWLPILPTGYLRDLEREVIHLQRANAVLRKEVSEARWEAHEAAERAQGAMLRARDVVEGFLPKVGASFLDDVRAAFEDRFEGQTRVVRIAADWKPVNVMLGVDDWRSRFDGQLREPVLPLDHNAAEVLFRIVDDGCHAVAQISARQLERDLREIARARILTHFQDQAQRRHNNSKEMTND